MNTTPAPVLDIQLPAVPGAASVARRAVHAVVAGRVADGYDVALAVSEAVSNVVVHAYRDREPDSEAGCVHVTVRIGEEELVVAVADEGVGMAPRPDSPGAGLGLPIIATLADRFEIQQRPSGTRVLLAFRRAPADAGS